MREPRYTMHGIRIFRVPDLLCDLFHLKPSRMLPRLPKPEGVYRKMVSYRVDPVTRESTRHTEYSDFWWSGYDFLFHLVSEERHPLLYQAVGQLYETAAGVYDWIGDLEFHRVTPEEREKLRLHELSFPDKWVTVGPVESPTQRAWREGQEEADREE